MEIKISIPDNKISKIADSFDSIYQGRSKEVTKATWLKEKVVLYIKSIVRQAEEREHQQNLTHEEITIT